MSGLRHRALRIGVVWPSVLEFRAFDCWHFWEWSDIGALKIRIVFGSEKITAKGLLKGILVNIANLLRPQYQGVKSLKFQGLRPFDGEGFRVFGFRAL